VLTDPTLGMVVPIEDVPALTDALHSFLNRPAPCPNRLSATVEGYRIGEGALAYLDLFAQAAA
jgi:hypothetical protein